MNKKITAGFLAGIVLGFAGSRLFLPGSEKEKNSSSISAEGKMEASVGAGRSTLSGPKAVANRTEIPDPALLDAGSPEALLAAAEQFDAERERDHQARAANDRAVWRPFYTDLLGLTAEKSELLEQAGTPEKMAGLLKTEGFLTASQAEVLARFETERSLNFSEITAQRQMAWVQEHLPLTTADKDRLWLVLSDHSLSLTEAGGDLTKRGELVEQLRGKIEAMLPPAAAGVALSYLDAGLEDNPPGDSTSTEEQDETIPEEDPPGAAAFGKPK